MNDFSLWFSGTCLKFHLFLRLASRYVLRSHSSTSLCLGGSVDTILLGEKKGNHESMFSEVQEMANLLWSTTAFLNRQNTVSSLNNSITIALSAYQHIFFPGMYWHDVMDCQWKSAIHQAHTSLYYWSEQVLWQYFSEFKCVYIIGGITGYYFSQISKTPKSLILFLS